MSNNFLMKIRLYALPLILFAVIMADCKKNTPQPASIVGTWNISSTEIKITDTFGNITDFVYDSLLKPANYTFLNGGSCIIIDAVNINAGGYVVRDSSLYLYLNNKTYSSSNTYIIKQLTSTSLILYSIERAAYNGKMSKIETKLSFIR